jgi:hypothetical protein
MARSLQFPVAVASVILFVSLGFVRPASGDAILVSALRSIDVVVDIGVGPEFVAEFAQPPAAFVSWQDDVSVQDSADGASGVAFAAQDSSMSGSLVAGDLRAGTVLTGDTTSESRYVSGNSELRTGFLLLTPHVFELTGSISTAGPGGADVFLVHGDFWDPIVTFHVNSPGPFSVTGLLQPEFYDLFADAQAWAPTTDGGPSVVSGDLEFRFTLRQVPEPGTGLLLLAGVAGVAFAAYGIRRGR